MVKTITVAMLIAAIATAQNDDDCKEDGFRKSNSCYAYTGDENDKENCEITYVFNDCSAHECRLIQSDYVEDCMPYLEDADFWYGIRDREAFNNGKDEDRMREYWNWYHDHSDDGAHTWEDGAGDWESDCWYEKHDLKFTSWDLGLEESGYASYQMFYDPCNEWHQPMCQVQYEGTDDSQDCLYEFENPFRYNTIRGGFENTAKQAGAEFISNYWADVYDFNREPFTVDEVVELRNQGWRCSWNYGDDYSMFERVDGVVEYCYNPENMEEFLCQMPIKDGLMRCNALLFDTELFHSYDQEWMNFYEDMDMHEHYKYFEEVVHSCQDFDKMCYWELCDDDMQEYGPETCWMEFCDNACGETQCMEWHAYDQTDDGEWLWTIDQCEMSLDDQFMNYQDQAMNVTSNFNDTISFAVDSLGLDSFINMTASAAAEQVKDFDFLQPGHKAVREFVNIAAADTSAGYDVNTDVVQALVNREIDPLMLVDQAVMMAEDADQGWVADWLSAFSDEMNSECDDYTFKYTELDQQGHDEEYSFCSDYQQDYQCYYYFHEYQTICQDNCMISGVDHYCFVIKENIDECSEEAYLDCDFGNRYIN